MTWLPTLYTDTPEEGFELAMKLSRMTIKKIQPDENIRESLRKGYASNADSLTAAAQVVATHFHTIALANIYWSE